MLKHAIVGIDMKRHKMLKIVELTDKIVYKVEVEANDGINE